MQYQEELKTKAAIRIFLFDFQEILINVETVYYSCLPSGLTLKKDYEELIEKCNLFPLCVITSVILVYDFFINIDMKYGIRKKIGGYFCCFNQTLFLF